MGYANRKSNTAKNITHTDCQVDKCPSFLTLIGDEQVVQIVHPFFLNYIFRLIFSILIIIFAVAFAFVVNGIGDAELPICLIVFTPMMLIGLVLILYIVINVYTTVYVLTTKRVVAKTGLISQIVSEVRIADVRGVNYSRGMWQTLIGVGDISIGTSATAGTEIEISGVKDYKKFVDGINGLRKK